jgi:hypothetical protein
MRRLAAAALVMFLVVSAGVARAELFAPSAPVPLTGDLQAIPLAVGDYSGDHVPDVLLGTLGGAALGILPGDGLGGFAAPRQLNRGGTGWTPVDVDHDGLADLAAVADLSPDRPMTALVMLADGAGGFGAPVQSDISTSRDDKQGVLFGDFDGSGDLDVLVATRPAGTASTTLHLARGNGTGAFGAETTQVLSGTAASLVHADDLNGDGRDDLVAYKDSGLESYASQLTGTFAAVGSTSLPPSLQPPWGAASGDFDGDGRPDVALTGYRCLETLLGDGTGRLASGTCSTGESAASPYHSHLAVGDLDGDGLPDLVSGDIWDGGGTSWFAAHLADGSGGLYFWDRFPCAREAFACEFPVIGDLDGDQRPDLVLGGSTGKVFVFRNTGRAVASLVAPDGSDFGKVPVGRRSDPLIVAVVNEGERPFDVTRAGITGTDAADYRIVDTDCPGLPLRGREFCGYLIDFTPATPGFSNAVLTIGHTAPGGPASIQLSGEGSLAAEPPSPRPTATPTQPPAPVSSRPPTLTPPQLLAALGGQRTITISRRAQALRVGTLANPPVASASLTLSTAAHKTVRIALGRVAIPAGRRRRVSLTLTHNGRALLRRVRTVRATLTVDALDVNRHAVRATASMLLRIRS